MIDAGPIELAVQGEAGIDIFVRREDISHSRAHFLCVATIDGDRCHPHEGIDANAETRYCEMAAALDADLAMGAPFSLTDTRTWPRLDGLRGFLYLDFFRSWQVADMAARRFLDAAGSDPLALLAGPSLFTGPVHALYDYNRCGLGCAVARLVVPAFAPILTGPGFADDPHRNLGYGFRMLGDLCMRGGEPALSLQCHALSVACGDNAFRRSRAIEAAHAAGDRAALDMHRNAYAAQWDLPETLAALKIGGSK